MIKKILTTLALAFIVMFATASTPVTAHGIGFVLATEMNADFGCGTNVDEYAESLNGVCITFGDWADTNTSKLRLDLEISQYGDMRWVTPWLSISTGYVRILDAIGEEFTVMILEHVIVIYPQEKE